MSRSEAEDALNTIQRWSGTGWGRTKCPYCLTRKGSEDRRGSFSIHRTSGFYHCFRCAVKGRLASGSLAAGHYEEPEDIPAGEGELGPPEGYTRLVGPQGAADGYRLHLKYLLGRGLPLSTIADARLGATLEGKVRGRIIVPILNDEGKWAGWSARKLPTKDVFEAMETGAQEWGPKYLYPPGMARRTLLYNEAALDDPDPAPLFIVEGVFDALPYWPNAVAVLGKPSEGQTAKLAQSKRRLVVALDGDAWEEGEMLAMRLAFDGADAVALRLPPKEDPATLDLHELLKTQVATGQSPLQEAGPT